MPTILSPIQAAATCPVPTWKSQTPCHIVLYHETVCSAVLGTTTGVPCCWRTPARSCWGWRRAWPSRCCSVSWPCGSPPCRCRYSSSRCFRSFSSRGYCRTQELRKRMLVFQPQFNLLNLSRKKKIFSYTYESPFWIIFLIMLLD